MTSDEIERLRGRRASMRDGFEQLEATADLFERRRVGASTVIAGQRVLLEPHYTCPGCFANVGELPHAEERECECGIVLLRLGNSMNVRRAERGQDVTGETRAETPTMADETIKPALNAPQR